MIQSLMKTSSIAICAALALAACGNPKDTKAQDGFPDPNVFGEMNRVAPSDAGAMKTSFAPVVQSAAPAVVNITAIGTRQVVDPFWGIPRGERQTGSVGSGVIVRADGVVVTNNHVIEGMSQIKVVLNDRREFPARVVLADERSDIAVLQLEGASGLPTLPIDDREEQQIGDLVLAIGNPFGVGQTVTNGIISALNRTDTGIQDSGSFIQTDAAINPGNSGGALVDMDGDLIGINTAIFSRSGSSSGVGFAVPAAMVRRVVDSAVGGAETVARTWLGVKGDTITAEIARSLGLDRPQGLLVTEIYSQSPGARAGIEDGDIITAIDGQEVNDQGGLNFRVGTRQPNDTVRVSLIRDGRPRTVDVRVQTLPGDASLDGATTIDRGSLRGAQVLVLNPARADALGGDPFSRGVIVVGGSRNTPASGNGFQRGDVIVSVNGRPVTAIADVSSIARGSEVVIVRQGRRIPGRLSY